MSSAYSPDDPHRLPDPSSRGGSSTPGNGLKILMYLVFVLALAATVIMFFVDSQVWLNIAVVTSLWAAFFGAVLVSRYSGMIGEERGRRDEQERRHRAEMARERSEFQRREVQLENDYRTRLGAGHDETLDAIRKELETMREQLSDLSGAPWSDEQVSLKARAERIIELERNVSRAGDPAPAPAADPAPAAEPTPAATSRGDSGQSRAGGRRGGFSTGTFAAVRWSGADSEETTQIPMVVDTRSMDSAAETAEAADSGEDAAASTAGESAGAHRAGAHEADGQSASEPTPAPAPEPTPEPAVAEQSVPAEPVEEPAQPRRRRAAEEPHGRRRADESDEGVTVAELMAQMKKNAQ